GYKDLKTEIAELKKKRLEVIEEVRRAAADKDFRENAPLAAAREEKGHIEGRIMELEETLKTAAVIDKEAGLRRKVGIGGVVALQDLTSGEELTYRIVDPREIDPLQGKISLASPLGKALVGRREGEVVELAVPVGKMRYQIKRVGS
ncbi:GreA/GreB family elongation factor, partial [Chloroflexota bacterium]